MTPLANDPNRTRKRKKTVFASRVVVSTVTPTATPAPDSFGLTIVFKAVWKAPGKRKSESHWAQKEFDRPLIISTISFVGDSLFLNSSFVSVSICFLRPNRFIYISISVSSTDIFVKDSLHWGQHPDLLPVKESRSRLTLYLLSISYLRRRCHAVFLHAL